MATIIVVEPNALLRLGIVQLLEKIPLDLDLDTIGYPQLFEALPDYAGVDLMLLSAPDDYDRTAELVAAAQRGYGPKRIVLLSDTPAPSYSLSSLPPVLVGCVSKYSPPEAFGAAITLALAGGTCFPAPVPPQASSDGDRRAGATPRRRWYDKQPQPPCPDAGAALFVENRAAVARSQPSVAERPPRTVQAANGEPGPLSAELIATESKFLRLTPRQYEVLALLARGYPIKSVSRELKISVATAKAHTETLYQRLSVHNRNAAVYTALSRGATLGWSTPDIAKVKASSS